MKRVLEMEGGDGCITVNVLNTSQIYNYKYVLNDKFYVVYILTQLKKRKLLSYN